MAQARCTKTHRQSDEHRCLDQPNRGTCLSGLSKAALYGGFFLGQQRLPHWLNERLHLASCHLQREQPAQALRSTLQGHLSRKARLLARLLLLGPLPCSGIGSRDASTRLGPARSRVFSSANPPSAAYGLSQGVHEFLARLHRRGLLAVLISICLYSRGCPFSSPLPTVNSYTPKYEMSSRMLCKEERPKGKH